jgi:peroxiredoxin
MDNTLRHFTKSTSRRYVMTQWMKQFLFVALFSMAVLSLIGSGLGAAVAPPPEGGALPQFELPVPQDAWARGYLGLPDTGKFAVPQIKARLVIIEIFSMYCPFCQKEAPKVNRLYHLIEENAGLRGKIKLIGIGAGNSPFEVDIFKKKYNVPFPLISDQQYAVHELLGSVRTPYFIAVRIYGDGTHRVIYSRLGAFESAERFLQLIIRSAQMQ